jgi:hypothetical protein
MAPLNSPAQSDEILKPLEIGAFILSDVFYGTENVLVEV